MKALLSQAVNVSIKQWQLLLVTVLTTVIFQMDYGIGDENFGFVLLILLPYLLWLIFAFCLPKLIHQKMEHPKTSLVEQLKIYISNIHNLIFPIMGLNLIIFALMFVIITMVYGIFNIFGIQNERSIFESGPTDLNYIIFFLLFNVAIAFFSFQGVLYFLKKQSFFRALKNSVILSKKHLTFVVIIGLVYFLTMIGTALIGSDSWYKNLINGIINGVEYFYFAVLILLFYQKKVE